jgi:hypothetical protein
MCWQCDHPDKPQADYFDHLRDEIAAHGWVVQYVDHDRMPFAYTIGLHNRGLPELIVSGLAAPRAQWLLNTFAKRMRAGRRPVPGNQVWLPAGTRVEFVDVARPNVHLVMAVGIEGPAISAIQLVWADGRGRWPWAPGFNDGRQPQAVLGERVA